jgi:hypothetical protein
VVGGGGVDCAVLCCVVLCCVVLCWFGWLVVVAIILVVVCPRLRYSRYTFVTYVPCEVSSYIFVSYWTRCIVEVRM